MGREKEAVIYVSERVRTDRFEKHDEFMEYLKNNWDTGDFEDKVEIRDISNYIKQP